MKHFIMIAAALCTGSQKSQQSGQMEKALQNFPADTNFNYQKNVQLNANRAGMYSTQRPMEGGNTQMPLSNSGYSQRPIDGGFSNIGSSGGESGQNVGENLGIGLRGLNVVGNLGTRGLTGLGGINCAVPVAREVVASIGYDPCVGVAAAQVAPVAPVGINCVTPGVGVVNGINPCVLPGAGLGVGFNPALGVGYGIGPGVGPGFW